MMRHLKSAVVPAYLVLCLLLGGSSAAGIVANLVLHLVGLVLIFWSFIAEPRWPLQSSETQLLAIALLASGFFALQLVPLPPALWSALPGREQIVRGYQLLGQPLPWQSISLVPSETVSAGLSLIPPLAILLTMTRLRAYDVRAASWAIGGVAVLSVILGTLQLLGGSESDSYLYPGSTQGSVEGFFANSNHLATFLVSAIPFLGALYALTRDRQVRGKSSVAAFTLVAAALATVLVGILVNWSFAGLGLAIPVTVASLAFFSKRKVLRSPLLTIGALVAAIAAFAAIYQTPIAATPEASSLVSSAEHRETYARVTMQAIRDFLPFGSGAGTFEDIYSLYEDPGSVDPWYINHAHNDYLEVLLELGVPGLILILLFLLWWIVKARIVLTSHQSHPVARAATIATAAVLIHSLVDYPLRTAAIAALFAACCLLMCHPPEARSGSER